jgi:hypothetical protein
MSDMTVVEFLEARMAEEKTVALQVIAEWNREFPGDVPHDVDLDLRACVDGQSMHVATSPERVLREVEAKRRIVAEHRLRGDVEQNFTYPAAADECVTCGFGDRWEVEDYGPTDYPCPTLRAHLSVYDGHPDYDEGWRP